MIDVRGGHESRIWWAWGKNPVSRFVDIVFIREIDDPYRVGTGFKVGRLHIGWVSEWRDDELSATGSREMTDVQAAILGRWGDEEDQPGQEEDPDQDPQDDAARSVGVGGDGAQ